MKLPATITSRNLNDTRNLAYKLSTLINSPSLLLVSGDLGTGKTTFIQFLGQSLGITQPMPSPTFTLIRQYLIPPDHQRQFSPASHFYHIDLFRLVESQLSLPQEIFELIADNSHVIAIEWPQPILNFVTIPYYHLRFKLTPPSHYIINLSYET